MYTQEQIESAVKRKGYVWFAGPAEYDVNIVAVRTTKASGRAVTNLFDDWLTLSYRKDGAWMFHEWQVTTDPGKKAMLQYSNPAGVAILVPGQYRGSHMIGLHQGKYEALRQQKPVTVYRDRNKDQTYDFVDPETGIFGINIHRSNPLTESTYVENWSEGCTVFKRVNQFNTFMDICRQARKIHGNSFTYTLLLDTDII
mgnify:CR=1 FL=1